VIALPSYIDPEMWSAFVETRKAMKVPFTQAAEKLIVRRLMKMHGEGWDVNASLEKSAIYGYRGVFEVTRRAAKTKDEIAQQVTENEKAKHCPPPPEIKARIDAILKRMPA
jgi:hypothetical protein